MAFALGTLGCLALACIADALALAIALGLGLAPAPLTLALAFGPTPFAPRLFNLFVIKSFFTISK